MLALLAAALLHFTASQGATAYRAYVADTPQAITPTPSADGTLSAIVAAEPPARIAVSALGPGGESARSNEMLLAQAATPTIALGTPTARPTPTGPIGIAQPSDLAVVYNGGYVTDQPGTMFAHEHIGATSWRPVEVPLPRPAIFAKLAVQDGAGLPWATSYAVAVRGSPTVVHCDIAAGGHECEDTAHIAGGDSFSLWLDNSQAQAGSGALVQPQAKVSLLRAAADKWGAQGDPYDAAVTLGGNWEGDPYWAVDGACAGPYGYSNGIAGYWGQPDCDAAAIVVPAGGGIVTGMAFSVWPPLEPGVVETMTLTNRTSGRDILQVVLFGGQAITRNPQCAGPDCPVYLGDRVTVRYNCKVNGAPCTSTNQPTLGHFRAVTWTWRGFGGFPYAWLSFGWPRTSPPPANPPYAGWVNNTMGYNQTGVNVAFHLPSTKSEYVTDFTTWSNMAFGHNTMMFICAGPTNSWIDLPCMATVWGATLPATGKLARGSGSLTMPAGGDWVTGAYPEMWPYNAPWHGTFGASMVVHGSVAP